MGLAVLPNLVTPISALRTRTRCSSEEEEESRPLTAVPVTRLRTSTPEAVPEATRALITMVPPSSEARSVPLPQ